MKITMKVIAMMAVVGLFLATAFRTEAYPPFVRKAEKFGAKDCLFCHKEPNGGDSWNERGNWLIAEKDKRKADAIDVEWLTDYKPSDAAAATGEKKEGEGEKKVTEGEKKSEDANKSNTESTDKDKDKDKNKDKEKDKDKDKDKTKKKNDGNN